MIGRMGVTMSRTTPDSVFRKMLLVRNFRCCFCISWKSAGGISPVTAHARLAQYIISLACKFLLVSP